MEKVDVVEKREESQVQFWSLVGPFLILLSVAVLLFKMSAHWYFPASALIGIPLCVKWKMKGMAASLACLFAFSIFAYRSVDLDEQYWYVGMSLAMAFSMIVLTLSLEEVAGLMSKMRAESQSRLDNFLHLDESLKTAEVEWKQERVTLQEQIRTLTQESTKVLEDKQIFFKLAQLSKDELSLHHSQHQILLEDLAYKKLQIAELNQKLEETELTIQDLVNTDNGQKIKHLTSQLDALSNEVTDYHQEKERLHLAIVRSQDQCENLRDLETRQKHLIKQQLTKMEELKSTCTSNESDVLSLQQQCEEMKLHCAELKQQCDHEQSLKQSLEIELDNAKKRYAQLQEESVLHESKLSEAVETAKSQQINKEREEQLENELNNLKEHAELSQKTLIYVQEQLHIAESTLKVIQENQSKLPSQDGNTRRMEAMYIQLKKQFEEKTEILEKTRQELFVSNEQLENIKRNGDEQLHFSISEVEKKLQQDIHRLTNELEELEQTYQFETEELHSIIARLSKDD